MNIDYIGNELEVMKLAKNYNNFLAHNLIKTIQKNCPGKSLKDCKILDFGAGLGTYAEMMRVKGIEVDCFEVDPTFQKRLTKNRFNTFNDFSKLQDNSYDFIYSLNVFEHIEDHAQVLGILEKKLKAKGGLYIYVPAFPILYSAFDKAVGHVRRYTKTSMNQLAQTSPQLKIQKMNYVDCLGMLAGLIYKVVGNKSGKLSPTPVIIFDRLFFPIGRILDHLFQHFLGKNLEILLLK